MSPLPAINHRIRGGTRIYCTVEKELGMCGGGKGSITSLLLCIKVVNEGNKQWGSVHKWLELARRGERERGEA